MGTGSPPQVPPGNEAMLPAASAPNMPVGRLVVHPALMVDGEDPIDEVAARMRAVATDHPLVVGAETSIAEAAATMLNSEVRHLTVRMPEAPPGTVSLRAPMAVLLQSCRTEASLTTLRISLTPPSEVPELWLG